MKLRILIGIICLISLSQCNFYDSLAEAIYKEPYAVHKQTKNFIKDITGYVDVLGSTVKTSKISRLVDIGVPQYAVDHFIAAVEAGQGKTFSYTWKIEIQGESAKYAYLEAHSSGQLIIQKINRKVEKCDELPFGGKRCHWEDNFVKRDFKEVELQYIKRGLTVKCMTKLKPVIDRLKYLSPNSDFIMELRTFEN